VVTASSAMLADNGDGSDMLSTVVQPPTSPPLTGSLELNMEEGMEPIIDWLLSLPGGIHFRKLTWTWVREGDHVSMMALVEGCSHTLESLDISWRLLGTSTRCPCPHLYLTSVSRQEVSLR
jgi:hypothetical protein